MTLINPLLLIILLILVFVVIIGSFVFIFKHEEKQSFKLLWTLFVLLIPFLGSIIYMMKYFVETIEKKKNR